MKTSEAIKAAGSAYRLSKLLGITRQAVSQWGATVPPLRVYELKDKHPELFEAIDKRKPKAKIK